ncbi:MAG: hypothetical protein WEA31_01150, partial [Pirellulales bacterium]
ACCPAHADSSPSLSVHEEDDGRVLMHCHSGCAVEEDIVPALGLQMRDLFPCDGQQTKPASPKSRRSRKQARPTVGHTRLVEPRLETAPGAEKNWELLANKAINRLTKPRLTNLAKRLGLPPWALKELHVGYGQVNQRQVYTFPEFDGTGRITGIALRYASGQKGFLKGGKRGLILPPRWHKGDGPILVVEGPSDTAALVAMGVPGVGRPSASGGLTELMELFAPLPVEREIIILGDFDPKSTGHWPGKDGAEKVAKKLATALKRPVHFSLPPNQTKDVRQWLINQLPQK